jgi:hypothetical protein
VCRKAARTGLWGSGEVTNRSTRNLFIRDLKALGDFIILYEGINKERFGNLIMMTMARSGAQIFSNIVVRDNRNGFELSLPGVI